MIPQYGSYWWNQKHHILPFDWTNIYYLSPTKAQAVLSFKTDKKYRTTDKQAISLDVGATFTMNLIGWSLVRQEEMSTCIVKSVLVHGRNRRRGHIKLQREQTNLIGKWVTEFSHTWLPLTHSSHDVSERDKRGRRNSTFRNSNKNTINCRLWRCFDLRSSETQWV